jgi:enoyl-CoA hydratase/carnithine racemase
MNLSLSQVFEQAGTQKVALVKDGVICYMVLNDKFNTIDFDFLDRVNEILDQVESSKEECVLVTISSHPRVFSSGFNFQFWEKSVENKALSISMMQRLMARLLVLNVANLSVCTGHTVAGGFMLALSHDQILMKNDPKLKI